MATKMQWILGMPRTKWVISDEELRDMWLDFPESQELFENLLEENDPLAYDKCIARALIWFNDALPQTAFSPINFPDTGLFLNMSFVEVLKVAERYHASNFTTASSGGTSTPINERYIALGQIRRELQAECKTRMDELKAHINYEEAWGGFSNMGARGEYGQTGYPFS